MRRFVSNRNKPRRVVITPKALPRPRRSTRVKKQPCPLTGGPFGGKTVWLCTPSTLPIVVRGMSGHYQNGSWCPT